MKKLFTQVPAQPSATWICRCGCGNRNHNYNCTKCKAVRT